MDIKIQFWDWKLSFMSIYKRQVKFRGGHTVYERKISFANENNWYDMRKICVLLR